MKQLWGGGGALVLGPCGLLQRGGLARVIGSGDLLQAGLHAPDLPGILGDGAVAGEFTTAGDVVDHHLGPRFRVLQEGGRGGVRGYIVKEGARP